MAAATALALASPAPPVPERAAPACRRPALRWWDPLLLVAVLCAIAAVVGPGLYTVDEGAYSAQARWVDEEGRWLQAYAAPDLGPGPEPAPLALSTLTDDGWAAFAKAPAYIWVLVGARQVHPGWGPVGASALGLLAAASVAARVGERLATGTGRVAFWLVGAASPLLFHANVVWAHTLAAAACLVALAGLTAILDPARRTLPILPGLAVAGGAATAALLRSEALLLAPAVALVLVVEFARHRRALSLAPAAAALVGAAGGHLINEALVARALGTSVPSRVQAGVAFDLSTRVVSGWNNLLAPGGSLSVGLTRLVAVVVLGFVAAKAPRARSGDRAPLLALLALAALAGLVGAAGTGSYHGLLPAAPLFVVGVVAALAAHLGPASRRVLAVATVYTGAVICVSEPSGGGLGWGGRYVVVAAGLAAPVAAAGLVSLARRGDVARWALVVALVGTVAVQVAGVRRLDEAHSATTAATPDLAADLAELADRDQLLITIDLRVGRVAPDAARRLPLLSVAEGELASILDRIGAAGIQDPLAATLRGGRWPSVPDGWRLGPVESLRIVDVAPLRPTGLLDPTSGGR